MSSTILPISRFVRNAVSCPWRHESQLSNRSTVNPSGFLFWLFLFFCVFISPALRTRSRCVFPFVFEQSLAVCVCTHLVHKAWIQMRYTSSSVKIVFISQFDHLATAHNYRPIELKTILKSRAMISKLRFNFAEFFFVFNFFNQPSN